MQSEYELSKRARAESVISTYTATERARLEAAQNKLHIEVSRKFGDRLSDIVVENFLIESSLDPAILAIVHGDENPLDYRQLVEDLSANDYWIARNLQHSDETLKESLRDEALAELSPQKRIAYSRNGSLEGYLKDRVAERMESNFQYRN